MAAGTETVDNLSANNSRVEVKNLEQSEFESAREFLRDVLKKEDREIENLVLVSASYTRLDTHFATCILTFQDEKTASSVISEKSKFCGRNI